MALKFNKRKATTHIVVHSSATRPSMNWGVREINAEHRKRGYLGVGYHVIIKRDGTAEEGRPYDTVGAHTKGHNSTSIGICLIGGVNDKLEADNNFTPAQFKTLDIVLQGLENKWPEATICGHRDMQGTATLCPSFEVRDWLVTGRGKAL